MCVNAATLFSLLFRDVDFSHLAAVLASWASVISEVIFRPQQLVFALLLLFHSSDFHMYGCKIVKNVKSRDGHWKKFP